MNQTMCTPPDEETYLNKLNSHETINKEEMEKMAKFSHKRMGKHRELVINNITKLLEQKDLKQILALSEQQFDEFKHQLIERGKQHDLSKYSEPEKTAYIYLNWKFDQEKTHKKKYDYPAGIQEKVNEAIQHHYRNNSHHSEYFCFKADSTKETDEERIKVLLKNMNNLDLLEMVADWMAVSQEYGTKCADYAKTTIGDDKAKPFSEEQQIIIFKCITLFEPEAKFEILLQQDNETHTITQSAKSFSGFFPANTPTANTDEGEEHQKTSLTLHN